MRYLLTPLQVSLALLIGSCVLVTTFDSIAVADHHHLGGLIEELCISLGNEKAAKRGRRRGAEP